MNTLLLKLLTPCAMLAMIIGCTTSPNVSTDSAPDFTPGDYSRFAYMEVDASKVMAASEVTPTLLATVRETTLEEFTGLGYELTDLADADFAVQIAGAQIPKVDTFDTGFYYGTYRWRYPSWSMYASGPDTTYEGVLLVNVFDTETKQLVWQGHTKRSSYSANIDPERVAAGLREIIRTFPPEAGTIPQYLREGE